LERGCEPDEQLSEQLRQLVKSGSFFCVGLVILINADQGQLEVEQGGGR
jgi:hypothetical protein